MMNDLVRQLYGMRWEEALERVKELVRTEQEAAMLVGELTRDRGWRERVAAARIVTAYRLGALAPNLAATFHEAPEYYTCRAFTEMLRETLGPDAASLLEEMKNYCPNDDYGKNMVQLIDSALSQTLHDKR